MKMKNVKTLFASLLLTLMVVACDEFGGDVDISKDDPVGTIILKLYCYSDVELADGTTLYLKEGYNFSYPSGQIAVVGKVNKLSKITTVPETGWTTSVAAKKGYGYVIRRDVGGTMHYARLYVASQIVSDYGDYGEILGVNIKYQPDWKIE